MDFHEHMFLSALLCKACMNPFLFIDHVILAFQNDIIVRFNQEILVRIPGDTQIFYSVDSTDVCEKSKRIEIYFTEFLQSL